MKSFKTDRIAAVVFAILILGCVLYGPYPLFSWTTLFSLVTFVPWWVSGIEKIPIGSKAQLLLFGERVEGDEYLQEGTRWVPWPLGLKIVDCKQTTIKLGTLKVITSDNVFVEIEGSVIRRVKNLNDFFDVDEKTIQQGFDDLWDQQIRSQVAKMTLAEVLQKHENLGDETKTSMENHAVNWGIEILKVVISGIKPGEEITKDLELQEREELQRKGQEVEIRHFARQVKKLMKSGIPQENAIRRVDISLGQPTKDFNVLELSPTTVDAIIAAIAAIKGK